MIFVVRDDLADIEKVVADTFTDLNVWERSWMSSRSTVWAISWS